MYKQMKTYKIATVLFFVSIVFQLFIIDSSFANEVCYHGFECPIVHKEDKQNTSFYIYSRFIVSVEGEKSQVGGKPIILKVYKRAKKRRSKEKDLKDLKSIINGKNKFLFKVEPKWSSYWLDGLTRKYLFVDSGTSVMRNLEVYGISKGRLIHKISLIDYVIHNDLLIYYNLHKELKDKNSKQFSKCEEEIGISYGLVLERLIVYNLKKNKKIPTEEFRCAYRE